MWKRNPYFMKIGVIFVWGLLVTLSSFFFFKDLFIYFVYKYTVAIFRHSRRGHRILSQMVVSHHVVAGI